MSTVTSNSVVSPPLTFVVDTTKSVKPDKYSIFNLTQAVVNRIQDTNANIPSYLLVTFNDMGPDFRKNVKIMPPTQDVIQFKQGGVQQSHLSSQFPIQCCDLPQLLEN